MSHEVLILNSDYEPLNVCNLRRAFILLYLGKADVLHMHEARVGVPMCVGLAERMLVVQRPPSRFPPLMRVFNVLPR